MRGICWGGLARNYAVCWWEARQRHEHWRKRVFHAILACRSRRCAAIERMLFRWCVAICSLLPMMVCGCVGPKAIQIARPKYDEAVRVSTKESWLRNLVRLRYAEPIGLLTVSGITTQFSLDGSAEFDGGRSLGNPLAIGTGGLGLSEKPTISFTPQESPEFAKSLMTPVSLDTLVLLGKARWELDRSLRVTISNINGLDNASAAEGPAPRQPPDFAQFQLLARQLSVLHERRQLEIMPDHEVQELGAPLPASALRGADAVAAAQAGFMFQTRNNGQHYVLTKERQTYAIRIAPDAMATPECLTALELMQLPPGRQSYRVAEAVEGQLKYGAAPYPRGEMRITTRSVLEMMFYLSKAVEVPAEHICDGIVTATLCPDGTLFDWRYVLGDIFQVHVQRHKPTHAAVQTRYRGYWFYIDDRDSSSKVTFAMLVKLFKLQHHGTRTSQPLLTLPVGG